MSLIPGTELNKAGQAEGFREQEAAADKSALEQAQTKAAVAKPPASDKYDVKEVKDTRPGSPTFGQTILAGVNKTDPTDVQFTGQVAAPKNDKPETKEEHLNEYAELRNRVAGGEQMSPEDMKKFQTLQTQVSVGNENAKQYNDRIQDLGIPANLKGHYNVLPTDTDAEAKQKEAAAQSLETRATAKTDKGTEQAGKIFDKYSAQVDKLGTPIEAAATRSGLLVHNIDLKNKQGDALIAPELLSIAAGGAGSGLRMNEAEISRVIGGRAVWDTLMSKAKQLQESGGTFDDTQRAQLRSIATYINDRNSAQTALLNKGRDALLRDQGSESGVRGTYEKIHKAVSEVGSKGIAPAGSKVSNGDYVYHNGEVLKVSIGKDGKPVGTPVEF
jgi:hypothetical protein